MRSLSSIPKESWLRSRFPSIQLIYRFEHMETFEHEPVILYVAKGTARLGIALCRN
jgi:hypothetical protein